MKSVNFTRSWWMAVRCFRIRFGLGLAVLAPAPILSAPLARPPNIVFILVDDLGWKDFGCYGSTFYETPNIDALASQGIRFTDAYAASHVCSPSRSAILTGKYPARTRNTNYFGSSERTGILKSAPHSDSLALGETTLAEALRAGGYRTGFIGKWHLGGGAFLPEAQGFDTNIAGTEAGHPNSYFSPYGNGKLTDGPKGEYLTDRLTQEAMSFIAGHRNVPFFLYLCHYAVHIPLQAKADLIKKYKAKAAKLDASIPQFGQEGTYAMRLVQADPVYAAMIESVDQGIGRILGQLQTLGLEDSTLVILSSDNGGLAVSQGTPTANQPLRAGKGWLYEGGLRVPLILKWPGRIPSGQETHSQVIFTDLYPTILECAGLPLRPDQHRDGMSFRNVLNGTAGQGERALFWHYPHYSDQGGRPGSAMRLGRYKLIEPFETNALELYDLETDPGERHNLAASMAAKALEMRNALWDWRKSVDAAMPSNYQAPTGLAPGRKAGRINPIPSRKERHDGAGRIRRQPDPSRVWTD